MSNRHYNSLPVLSGSVRREMNRAFNELFGRTNRSEVKRTTLGAMSGIEDVSTVRFEVDVPGISLENLDITFEKGRLSIRGERVAPEDSQERSFDERCYGSFERVISLPDTVDTESVSAELLNGVLRIELSKRPEAVPQRIEIKTADAGE